MVIDSQKGAASISWIWWRADQRLTWCWHLCWFYKCPLPAPIKHHPHQLQTHPKAICPGLFSLRQPQLPLNLFLSSQSSATDDVRLCLFIPACFRLALCSCRKTSRSALSAITEKTEEAAAWFSRLWGLPFSIIFGSVMIYAACVQMHVCLSLCLTHFSSSFSFLSVCTSRFLFFYMLISHLLSWAGPLT